MYHNLKKTILDRMRKKAESIDLNQWNNVESMHWFRKAFEKERHKFNLCNLKAPSDILDDVLEIRYDILGNEDSTLSGN